MTFASVPICWCGGAELPRSDESRRHQCPSLAEPDARAAPRGDLRADVFSWTELGARHVGIVKGLLATFRLHDINPYDYFVDVL